MAKSYGSTIGSSHARHPIEEEHAPSTRKAYRWRSVPKLQLVIVQFVSQYGVGVFVRGEKGINPTEVEYRLGPYAARLKKALGLDEFFIVGHGWRQRAQEMFVPLVHSPGHAQADFGEAIGVIGGVERKDPLLCDGLAAQRRLLRGGLSGGDDGSLLRRPRSGVRVLRGVPQPILYDNTKIAVARISRGS